MCKKIKLIIALLLLSLTISTKAAESIVVSAVVGNINHAPIVISVTPNGDPELLATNSLQNFSITYRDDELNHMYYTITTETNGGYISPISGEISTTDYVGNLATIDFSFLAPTIAGVKTITITLNDGPNVLSKDINIYIY